MAHGLSVIVLRAKLLKTQSSSFINIIKSNFENCCLLKIHAHLIKTNGNFRDLRLGRKAFNKAKGAGVN